MTRCEWASCHAAGPHTADGWDMCAEHLAEHHAMQREERPDPPERPRPTIVREIVPDADARATVIRELNARGLSDQEIGNVLGLGKSTINGLRARHGIPPVPRRRAECGTRNGYLGHRERDEKACEPCAEAATTWRRKYEQARRLAS